MRILLRADGDHHIGTGHVMRMLALAQQAVIPNDVTQGLNDVAQGFSPAIDAALKGRATEAVLASARLDDALAARARETGVLIALNDVEPGSEADSAWLIEQAAASRADWVVVDGYSFDAAYQESLRTAGLRVLFVDDHGHCSNYAAQLVLNQNVFATSAFYTKRHHDTRLLLGPSYALLRREFVIAAVPPKTIARRADRILVTLGGADPENAAERIVRALERMPDPDLHVKVVVGQSNPHAHRLTAGTIDRRIEILSAVGAGAMVPLMAWADLAITGAGTTVYELCFMGVPAMVVAIAPDQRDIARALGHLAVDLGWHEDVDDAALARTMGPLRSDMERRSEMSRRGRELVDGLGAERVIGELVSW